MTEYSHFWGGDHIGDIASDWRVSDDDFAKMLRNVFGLGDAYEWSVGLPAGYSIKTQGGVLKGVLNECEITEDSLNIRIDSGVAIVDGRIYYNESLYSYWGLAVPAVTTEYYIFALRALDAGQTVRIRAIGPQTDPANLVQTFTQGSDVYEPLAAVSITPGSVVTIYDLRRFIRSQGYQIPILVGRQGDEDYDEWNVAGSDSITPDSQVGILFGTMTVIGGGGATGYGQVYLGGMFKHGHGFATVSDTDPNKIITATYPQQDTDSHRFIVAMIRNDGGVLADTDVHFMFIGELNPDWHARFYPLYSESEEFVIQDE